MQLIRLRASGDKVSRNCCAHCGGKFGMVRHRKAFKQFCCKPCLDANRVESDARIERLRKAAAQRQQVADVTRQ